MIIDDIYARKYIFVVYITIYSSAYLPKTSQWEFPVYEKFCRVGRIHHGRQGRQEPL